MIKKNIPKCPYCGKKTKYFKLIALANKKNHLCDYCNKISIIYFDNRLRKSSNLCLLIALIFTILYTIFGNKASLFGTSIIFLIFILFYISMPLFSNLYPIKNIESNGDTKVIKIKKK